MVACQVEYSNLFKMQLCPRIYAQLYIHTAGSIEGKVEFDSNIVTFPILVSSPIGYQTREPPDFIYDDNYSDVTNPFFFE